ncbi:MAG TPA: TldD/PmbA family protein [Thermoclostridium sp.]
MITVGEMEKVLQTALSGGGDFAELFFEDKDELNIKCSQQILKGITSVHIFGAGIYVLSGTRSVYVYTNNLSFNGLMDAAKRAAELLNVCGKQEKQRIVFSMQPVKNPNSVVQYPGTVPHSEKIKVIRETDLAARSTGVSIRQLNVDYFDTDQRVLIVNSEGLYTEDRRVTSRIRIQATVENRNNSHYEWTDFPRPYGFEAFKVKDDYISFAQDFIRDIADSMNAVSAPSCVVPVVLEAGSCGVIWHEACGHPLEATAIAANNSDFAGKLGQQVASPKVTVIDDGSVPGLYGSAGIDDEGHPTQKNVLIENGVLKGYLCDRLGGRKLNMPSTGSGRRQGYMYPPAARMSNTYLAPGTDDEDEMISSIDEGLFVKRLGGGNSGREFSVSVSEGYWIKNGKIDHRVKGLMLNARGIDLIKLVDRVGSRIKTEGGGFCGSVSGLVTTTSFQPRIRISSMTVGGEGGK